MRGANPRTGEVDRGALLVYDSGMPAKGGRRARRTVGPRRIEPPRPLPKPRRIPLPDVPCPWSERELADIVERACAFIAEAKERLGNRLGREVGEHLLERVYGGDETYVRLNDPTKDRSLWDIAEATGVPEPTLRSWVVWAIVRGKLRKAGCDPDLSMKHLLALDALGDDVETMVALVRWAEDGGASAEEMRDVVRRLVSGGRIPRRRRARRARPRIRPRPDDLLIPRLLGVVDRRLVRARMSSRAWEDVRRAVREILSLVEGA